ncbi:hypothetical protein [Streptomyces sp. MBT49]|nr:hypothetical protein [Streptomyces sp. MBT49]
MTYEVDLAVQAEDVLNELPEHGHQEVMEVIAAVLVRPGHGLRSVAGTGP